MSTNVDTLDLRPLTQYVRELLAAMEAYRDWWRATLAGAPTLMLDEMAIQARFAIMATQAELSRLVPDDYRGHGKKPRAIYGLREWLNAQPERYDTRQQVEAACGQLRLLVSMLDEPAELDTQQSIIEVLMGDEDRETMDIVSNKKLSTDEKMRQIVRVNPASRGWSSQIWAKVLGVSRQAIEKTATWKLLKQQRKED